MTRCETPRVLGVLTALLALTLLIASAQPVAAQCTDLPGCVLVWSDEFDGTEVDPGKWTFQLGDGTEVGLPPGWGNNELQYYQAENATVAGGLLTITARQESVAGYDYTSARLRSLGKGDWTFGRMEMRARMPIGQGFWPAFWMLPSDTSIYGPWAASGEIDIMEYIGSEPGRVFGSIHYGASFPGNVSSSTDYFLPSGTFNDDFHVFAVEWEFGEIRWYVDGMLFATRTDWFSTGGPYPAPFDVDFHLLLNLAVGGNLPGPPDGTSVFPQEYVIDYVRVYQVPNDPPVVEITSPTASDTITPGDDLTITVSATDDGSVQTVQFLQDSAVLGEDTTPPYELAVPSVAAGCYTLRARARDDGGKLASSLPVDIMVGAGCPQAPYRMTPAAIPGTVEAEDYDLGGQGLAYNDADASNNGGAYRPGEGVDLEGTTDAGFGFNVGWTVPGEWIEYAVDVAAGTYDVAVRVASATVGGTLHIELDGVDKTGPISFAGTGGWQSWTTVSAGGVAFDGGVQTMRLAIDAGEFNVNKITIGEPAPPGPSSPSLVVFDDFEDGDALDWFFFGGNAAGGGGGVLADRPQEGDYYFSTGWGGQGSASVFYGGFFKNVPEADQLTLPADPWLNVWVLNQSNATVDQYTLEITIREDLDGNGWTNGQEDSRAALELPESLHRR
jgi:beta-glucanase (GH16 family)